MQVGEGAVAAVVREHERRNVQDRSCNRDSGGCGKKAWGAGIPIKGLARLCNNRGRGCEGGLRSTAALIGSRQQSSLLDVRGRGSLRTAIRSQPAGERRLDHAEEARPEHQGCEEPTNHQSTLSVGLD